MGSAQCGQLGEDSHASIEHSTNPAVRLRGRIGTGAGGTATGEQEALDRTTCPEGSDRTRDRVASGEKHERTEEAEGRAGREKTANRIPAPERQALHQVVAAEVLRTAKKPLHQSEIAKVLIEKKGVKSKSKRFPMTLGIQLGKDSRFKRVARATYTLK